MAADAWADAPAVRAARHEVTANMHHIGGCKFFVGFDTARCTCGARRALEGLDAYAQSVAAAAVAGERAASDTLRKERDLARGWLWWLGKMCKGRVSGDDLYALTQGALAGLPEPRTTDDAPMPWRDALAMAHERFAAALRGMQAARAAEGERRG